MIEMSSFSREDTGDFLPWLTKQVFRPDFKGGGGGGGSLKFVVS